MSQRNAESPVIVWFRQDLRVADNPALAAAVETGAPVLPVYVLDDDNAGQWRMGGASRWWLHHSLKALNSDLGGTLHVLVGKADDLVPDLARKVGAQGVFWNRCYEPWRIARDKTIKTRLADDGTNPRSFNGSLLFEPHTVCKKDGGPYKVFTPFWRKGALGDGRQPAEPLAPALPASWHEQPGSIGIDALELLPSVQWYDEIEATWVPGEKGAAQCLDEFLDSGLDDYREGRNHPARKNVSRLSPHLHFGEISPRQVWQATQQVIAGAGLEGDGDTFLSEIGWREFSYNLLYHWPELPTDPLQQRFEKFPWREDEAHLDAWQRGQTGYPIVDAGMRELWRTGYMHNRVRMIVGSFLVKNLRLHWHHGEAWFWDTLLDADLASNSASWQWIAGCGADAAPYFRVFNPVTQSEKFDKQGEYLRTYVPEIAKLPDKLIHAPWKAGDEALASAGIRLGTDYPEPIVDLKASREEALAAFAKTKTGST